MVESVDRGQFVDLSSLPPPPGTAFPHRSPRTSVTVTSVQSELDESVCLSGEAEVPRSNPPQLSSKPAAPPAAPDTGESVCVLM